MAASISIAETTTPRERGKWLGRDELNLADWRISVPTHQQPRKADGGKLDVIEYEIPGRDGRDQRVTLMAPSLVGLPTPSDEDMLLALLYLAKEQGFREDTVRFSTTELCRAMHRSVNQEARDRIEDGLTRLKALTIKYELAWYDKIKAEVEPVLITGIVAEAKFMRRRGRPRADEPSDSYVQWTKNFYKTISSGNLTEIDLELYFSFSRPGAKQLYRHLNKRFYGRRESERYERDLVELACGHLGMTRSKFLKRNLDQCIRELEEHGYIAAEGSERRYRKVRPGVWRVGFALAPQYVRSGRRRGVAATESRPTSDGTPAQQLVTAFHAAWSGGEECRPSPGEIAIAERLIAEHGFDVLLTAVPRLISVLRQKWPDCKTFKGFEVYLSDALAPVREREQRVHLRRKEANDRAAEEQQREQARMENQQLENVWRDLSADQREDIRRAALRGHPRDIAERHPALAHSFCLAELRRRTQEEGSAGQTP